MTALRAAAALLGVRLVLAVCLVFSASAGATADEPTARSTAVPIASQALPLVPPERPFLLVDAPRRFRSGGDAQLRVQLRGGGGARVALYRVIDRGAVLALAGARQGAAIAGSALGAEAEALIGGDAPLPRTGRQLELLRVQAASLFAPRGARQIGWSSEDEVYDSNESQEDDVATYWVRAGGWSVRNVELGRLPAGLYLARVYAGPWATTALLSVGELTLLARRGDREDVVFVSDAMGVPQPGIEVRATTNGRELGRGRSDARGELRLPASDAGSVRFAIERGDDVVWADVAHARLGPCDPR
ncbi:MAG TPA: hypothetical protein VK509_00270, partial [Polyangiales bacterium]|nr:hypothetical protein [Polyangiales bacterium]